MIASRYAGARGFDAEEMQRSWQQFKRVAEEEQRESLLLPLVSFSTSSRDEGVCFCVYFCVRC